ncbi:hypothetical protein SAMN05444409_2105 [Epilithonimonas zeae]|uniref:Uncharacterized protein n=2 Tax=Epilithonimonas zeae TaxID=1416779 RepID=A0A1N6GX88_9FLAO|nr:hypothetical protein SAMN05444409_2105 [Epilithonimonas zeae]
MKINSYWYSLDELKSALEKKGYTILTLEISTSARDYPLYETYALKDYEDANCLNTIKSVALKEFDVKPKLV